MTSSSPSNPLGNPGWVGRGVPTKRELLLSRPIRAAVKLRRGQTRAARNLLKASTADLWNFHLAPRLPLRLREKHCPCCGYQGPAFAASSTQGGVSHQARCPQCDSRSRHRGLSYLLPQLVDPAASPPILFFAPEGVTLSLLERLVPRSVIETADLNDPSVDHPGTDIQKMSLDSERYGFIVCNHVLEHVPDDVSALHECARVLKPGGVAVFTIPGAFDGSPTVLFDRPDPNGHLRLYGLEIADTIREAFGGVRTVSLAELAPPSAGVRKNEVAFVAEKQGAPNPPFATSQDEP